MKSSCCNKKIYSFGPRRYQCSFCKKTWRIRLKKRGRKKIRVTTNIVKDVLLRGETLSQRSKRGRLSKKQYLLRYHRSLDHIKNKDFFLEVPKGKLILIVDGLWVISNKKRYVVYLMAIRSINKIEAILLPPIILSGSEIRKKWELAIQTIPIFVKNNIIAIVCDGISGLPNIAKNERWIIQRCNFHFIKTIERFRGKKNKYIQNKELREDMYQMIRKAMIVPDGIEYVETINNLEKLALNNDCPKWVRIHANEFLRHRESFRSYLRYPKYNLPFTTSSMENLCGSVRDLLRRSRGFKTEKSLYEWIREFIKLKKKIICRGKNQPN